jgi:DNA-binding transcriptional regulator YiaG
MFTFLYQAAFWHRGESGWLKTSKASVTWVGMDKDDVRKLRESLGYSQRSFAKILKVSNMMIQRAEAKKPSRTLVLLIERALAEGLLKPSKRQD